MAYMWRVIFVTSLLGCSSEGLFVRKPGEVRVCMYDDAPFPWHFDETATAEVMQIFWMYMGTGATLMGWYKDTDITHTYKHYKNRVKLLEGTNAGIVLENVNQSDTGNYKIEMSGPGDRDIAYLRVYKHVELTPALQFDNRDVTAGFILDKRNVSRTTITIKSAFDLPSNITIIVADKITVSCVNTTLCSTVILLKEIPSVNFTVKCSVDYGICAVQQDVIHILKHPNDHWRIVISVCVLLVLILISLGVVLGVWVILRNKERENPRTHLNTCQRRYVHNRCLFTPMKALTRWSSSVWDVQEADEGIKRGDAMHPATKKALVQSDDPCSVSNEELDEPAPEKPKPFVKLMAFFNRITQRDHGVSRDVDKSLCSQSERTMQRSPTGEQIDQPDVNTRETLMTSHSADSGSGEEPRPSDSERQPTIVYSSKDRSLEKPVSSELKQNLIGKTPTKLNNSRDVRQEQSYASGRPYSPTPEPSYASGRPYSPTPEPSYASDRPYSVTPEQMPFCSEFDSYKHHGAVL